MVQVPVDAKPVVVVLAAGRGQRFGASSTSVGHKLEQPLGASTVLGGTLLNAVRSGLPLVVVTTPMLMPLVSALVAERDIVLLPAVGSAGLPLGMGYSIAAGVTARSHAPGWLIMPGDMPLVQPDTLREVARALPEHPVAYAQHRGRRGHPVGFAAELYSELAILSGDEGARRLIGRYPAHGVEVGDEGTLFDLDTEDDLARLRARHGAPAGEAAV